MCRIGRPWATIFRCWRMCSRRASIWAKGFHRAGGVPAVMSELLRAGKAHGDALTVTGKTVAENYRDARIRGSEGDPDL